MTDLYHLFQELETAEIFEMEDEFNRIKAQISKHGNFERLKFNHEKKADFAVSNLYLARGCAIE